MDDGEDTEDAGGSGRTLYGTRLEAGRNRHHLPTYKPLLGADLAKAAAWVNAQPDWAPLEVVGDFMRERALEIISAFPWARTRTRSDLDPSR